MRQTSHNVTQKFGLILRTVEIKYPFLLMLIEHPLSMDYVISTYILAYLNENNFFFFPDCLYGTWKLLGQELNLCHSSDPRW